MRQRFKNGPSKICGRQPLKNVKGYGLLKLSHICPISLIAKTTQNLSNDQNVRSLYSVVKLWILVRDICKIAFKLALLEHN